MWLHTGDIGYIDEDGYVFLTDRKKDLIKTSGYQVWPREVEEVLSAARGDRRSRRRGRTRHAERRSGQGVGRASGGPAGNRRRTAQASAARQLAPFKVPQAIEFRTELPKSLIGKILRRELVRQHVSAA